MPTIIKPATIASRSRRRLTVLMSEVTKLQRQIKNAERKMKGVTPRSESYAHKVRKAALESQTSFTSRSLAERILGTNVKVSITEVNQTTMALKKLVENGQLVRTPVNPLDSKNHGQLLYTKIK